MSAAHIFFFAKNLKHFGLGVPQGRRHKNDQRISGGMLRQNETKKKERRQEKKREMERKREIENEEKMRGKEEKIEKKKEKREKRIKREKKDVRKIYPR